MKFAYSKLGLLFLLLPIVALYFFSLNHKLNEQIRKFADPKSFSSLFSNFNKSNRIIRQILLLGVILFCLLASLGPQWGYHFEEVTRKGVDIFILADLSTSMLAEDVKPNRLEQLKRKIHDLLRLSQGDRIGLIAFAGKAVLLCPLTLDYQAIEQFLEDINTDLISIQGTNFSEAIDTALKNFGQGNTSKALMLLTDGEDHSDELNESIDKLKKQQISLYILGIGSLEGAPIPLEKGQGGFKKDETGSLVVSKLEERSLGDLALATGGDYVKSVTTDDDLNKLYVKSLKGALSASEFKASKKKVYQHRYQWPLAIALCLLILEFFWGYKPLVSE